MHIFSPHAQPTGPGAVLPERWAHRLRPTGCHDMLRRWCGQRRHAQPGRLSHDGRIVRRFVRLLAGMQARSLGSFAMHRSLHYFLLDGLCVGRMLRPPDARGNGGGVGRLVCFALPTYCLCSVCVLACVCVRMCSCLCSRLCSCLFLRCGAARGSPIVHTSLEGPRDPVPVRTHRRHPLL